MLEDEGIRFKANGHVDMVKYLWEPELNDDDFWNIT
jgi:hypothetical protein